MTEIHEDIQKAAQINFALGLFILFFGLVTIVAMFFSDTTIGRNTSLICGLVLSTIGGGMCAYARFKSKKKQP